MIVVNERTGVVYRLDKELVIGRSPDCDIPVTDEKVSRRHARIFGEGRKWFIQDLGSINGTFVNEAQVTKATELLPGCCVRVGNALFLVRAPEASQDVGRPSPAGTRSEDAGNGSPAGATYVSVDTSKYDLPQEAAKISDRRESARLRARFAALSSINRILHDLTETQHI